MAVEIKSGDGSDLLTVDAVSKAIRVTNYNSDGVEGTRELPVSLPVAPESELGEDILGSLDVTEYKFVSLQLTGTWEGVVTFQGSNDNGTFYDIVGQDVTSLTSPYSAATSVNGLFKIPVLYKWFRARVTTYTSGTVTGTAFGHKEDNVLNSVGQVGIVTLAEESTKVIGTVNVATLPTIETGTINAADTAIPAPADDGVLLSGTPSVGSTVVLDVGPEDSAWALDITGTLGGATFYFEASASSTDGVDGGWVPLNGRRTGLVNSTLESSTTTDGLFRGTLAAMSYFRVRAVGGVGIDAVVNIRVGHGTAVVFLAASIPEGVNQIGSVDVSNFPASQTVDGTVTVSNLPATQPVSGTVAVNNFPATQPVSGSVTIVGNTSLTPFFAIGATGTNETAVSASPSVLRSIVFTNLAATPRHLKFYDIATTPVAGAGTPVIVCSLAAAGTLAFPLPVEGFPFANGIGFTMVLGAANNSTSPATTQPDFTVSMIYSS
jgi:hypothetical protein